ncbi:MAG: helix-turn-helix domain-containing protein [Vicinamibacteria bacterium]
MRSLHDSRYKALLGRLRSARQAAGLTQEEAATAVGRPQSFVSKCEAGERRVDAIELLEFARLYGRPLAYFVAEGGGRGGASLSSEAPAVPRYRSSARSRRRRRR